MVITGIRIDLTIPLSIQFAAARLDTAGGLLAQHGMRYMFEQRRHWTERLWWLFAFALSVYGCGRLMLNVYDKWHQSPVIVTFAEEATLVADIRFPAVTICPETKSLSVILNFTKLFDKSDGGNIESMTPTQ